MYGIRVPVGDFKTMVSVPIKEKNNKTTIRGMFGIRYKDWPSAIVFGFDKDIGLTKLSLAMQYEYPITKDVKIGLSVNYLSYVVNKYDDYKPGDISVLDRIFPIVSLSLNIDI